jgi:hypothetical protein
MKNKKSNEFYEEEIFFEENVPPCKVVRTNHPNLELMAKAFRELYYETKDEKSIEKDNKETKQIRKCANQNSQH